ncbi:MAG: hypothetical protein ACHQT7_01940 [Candidatus Levyibacteriota bacterium]
MKFNKWVIIGTVVAVVLIGIGTGAYFLIGGSSSSKPLNTLNQGQQVKKLTASDIGLVLTVRPDKKGVILKVTKLTGITSVEYELSYDALETQDGETATVPKGVVGSPIDVKPGDTEISRNLDFGTCSRNVCRYDNIKSDISVAVKVNYKDGTVGGVNTTIKLSELQ